jgi:hypothetical protein
MNDEEILKEAIENRIFIHDASWSSDKLCNMLVDEIKKLKLELEKVKAYDYRSYAPNVWTQTGE